MQRRRPDDAERVRQRVLRLRDDLRDRGASGRLGDAERRQLALLLASCRDALQRLEHAGASGHVDLAVGDVQRFLDQADAFMREAGPLERQRTEPA